VDVRYAQLRNQLYSVSYKFRAGNFSFEPYALYRVTRDLQNWWEAATIVYFKEKIWLGGSYHSTQGAGFFLGLDVKEKLRVGYSFELPPVNKEFVSVNSHEIQLNIRLGKKKVFKWASRFEEKGQVEVAVWGEGISPVVNDTVKTQPPVMAEVDKTIKESAVEKKEVFQGPIKDVKVAEQARPATRPPIQEVLAPGFYIIAGSFRSIEYAHAFGKKLNNSGVAGARVGFNKVNSMQCVYVFSSFDLEECKKALDQLRLKQATKDVWILKIP
jgi:hypothetical protein